MRSQRHQEAVGAKSAAGLESADLFSGDDGAPRRMLHEPRDPFLTHGRRFETAEKHTGIVLLDTSNRDSGHGIRSIVQV